MDESLRETIRALAGKHGLDPELLEASLLSGDIPEELAQGMAEVLGDIGRFGEALKGLDE